MLVLSRRQGEEICLPDLGVTIKIVHLKGRAAVIGVEAPRIVRIQRGELVTSGDRPDANAAAERPSVEAAIACC